MDLDKVVIITWKIWEARNKLFFQRQLVNLESLGDLIGKYVDQTRAEGDKTKEKGKKLSSIRCSSLYSS